MSVAIIKLYHTVVKKCKHCLLTILTIPIKNNCNDCHIQEQPFPSISISLQVNIIQARALMRLYFKKIARAKATIFAAINKNQLQVINRLDKTLDKVPARC